MNKKAILNYPKLILTFLIIVCQPSLAQERSDKHFLWKIESGKSTVYLLGSIHLAKDDLYPLDKIITDAYEKSDFLVVEVNMNNANPFDILIRANFQDGRTLKSTLTPDIYESLKSEFDSLHFSETLYSKMKPWFAVMTLTNLKLMKDGYKPESGIDMHFMGSAKEQNKEILELETADFQINLMDSVLGNFQNEFVLYTLNDFDSTVQTVDTMFSIWKSGNQKALEESIIDQFKVMPNANIFIKKFLTERNFGMAEKIKSYLKTDKTYFVIVGSAHIIGKDGILDILSKSNYSIKQL